MGCADSKLDASKRRGTISGRRNTIVTKPNVKINIGTGINIKKDKKTKVIFIFGKFNVVFTPYLFIASVMQEALKYPRICVPSVFEASDAKSVFGNINLLR